MPRSWLRIALVANDAFAAVATIGGLLCRNRRRQDPPRLGRT